MFIKYSKSIKDILKLKSKFISHNEDLLNNELNNFRFYSKQVKREYCVVCLELLKTVDITKYGIEYSICSECGHLNGLYQDTEEYAKFIYMENEGENYSKAYESENTEKYHLRTNAIYSPKVEFYLESLKRDGVDPSTLSYVDIGCGAGYFINALKKNGVTRCEGYEINESLVRLAKLNKNLNINKIQSINETIKIVKNTTADVVCLIGVLEHLQNPKTILDSIKDNKNIKYVFLLVPMFSVSVMFESAFPKMFPRHMGSDHTHLYSEKSIEWITNKYSFKRISEWWFGMDAYDLYRGLITSTENMSDDSKSLLIKGLENSIDEIQQQFDKQKLCSELHTVFKL